MGLTYKENVPDTRECPARDGQGLAEVQCTGLTENALPQDRAVGGQALLPAEGKPAGSSNSALPS
jgi:hypothetical protein